MAEAKKLPRQQGQKEIVARYPIWFVGDRKTMEVSEDGRTAHVGSGTRLIAHKARDGVVYFPVFTDLASATRFMNKGSFAANAVVLTIRDHKHFVKIMSMLPDAVGHIGIHTPARKSVLVHAVADTLANLRKPAARLRSLRARFEPAVEPGAGHQAHAGKPKVIARAKIANGKEGEPEQPQE
jgi:hypothetical protein